jgi:hypothetical protein
VNLIESSGTSDVPETPLNVSENDRNKVLEAVKIMGIQNEVGFTFQVEDGDIVKQLIQHEHSDKNKKMDWDHQNVDQ